ncbi:MAG: hypothetical protein NTW30_05685 [Candidatus Aenigmarchaeota archaeon]|nr:hypothetical protein [Candidatus Aenigmarchaeota archaeon]
MDYVNLEEDGKTLTINITMKDEEVYRFLQEVDKEKRIERLITALRIGILGLKRMGTGENVDYVEKEFNTLLSKFERIFASIEINHLDKLSLLLRTYFGKGGTVESIFNPMNGNTPLAILRKEIITEIRELKDEIIIKNAKEEVVNSTTLKGFKFEDTCEEILSDCVCINMGDELERKTNVTGMITGCMTGDFLITLKDKPNKKIVFEIKDVENISQPMIIETMEKAMKNRGASYGIFVVRYVEGLPRKIGIFNEFRGNILVVALGDKNQFLPQLLYVAYQWAKFRLNTEINMEQKSLKILDEGIKQISEKLEVFSQIQRQCTNIEKANMEIRKYSDELKNEIEEHIHGIKKAINSLENGDDR